MTHFIGIEHKLGSLGHVADDNHDALDGGAGVNNLGVAKRGHHRLKHTIGLGCYQQGAVSVITLSLPH